MTNTVKAGDFLKDLSIQFELRSSEADTRLLLNLSEVIATSLSEVLQGKLAQDGTTLIVKISPTGKKLTSLTAKLHIK